MHWTRTAVLIEALDLDLDADQRPLVLPYWLYQLR